MPYIRTLSWWLRALGNEHHSILEVPIVGAIQMYLFTVLYVRYLSTLRTMETALPLDGKLVLLSVVSPDFFDFSRTLVRRWREQPSLLPSQHGLRSATNQLWINI